MLKSPENRIKLQNPLLNALLVGIENRSLNLLIA